MTKRWELGVGIGRQNLDSIAKTFNVTVDWLKAAMGAPHAETAKMSKAERLARAVLLFFDAGSWDDARQEEWLAMTGTGEATSKVLANLAREVRDDEERK